MHDLLLTGGRVYVDGRFEDINIVIDGETITAFTRETKEAKKKLDCHGLMILPGLIDPHVHMELDLGFATSCDDFYKGSVAAVRGGVTTLIDFLAPIENETEITAAFDSRLNLAKECVTDYAMHATLGNFKGDVVRLIESVKQLGMNSVKVFTTYSESNRMVSDQVLTQLLDQEIVTMVHAEDDRLVDSEWQEIATYESSRPLDAELSALKNLLLKQGRGTLYVVHVSSGSGVKLLAGRDRVVIESCPHYFYLTKDSFKGEYGGLYLLAPPLRNNAEREKLNKAIENVYTIGTDHCPFTKSEKLETRSAKSIPKGIGSIQYSFLLMYDRFGEQVIEKMSRHVAEVFRLKGKGKLAEGCDADLFLFDPLGETLVESDVETEDYSVYEGMKLKGRIVSTMLRGKFVMEAGKIAETSGRYIRSECDEGACSSTIL